MEIKKILKKIGSIIVTVFLTILAIFIVFYKTTKKDNADAEKAKEDKRNELEEKTPDDIAANSPNPDTISTNIKREQEELRQRLRDRFKKNIPGNGSTSDN